MKVGVLLFTERRLNRGITLETRRRSVWGVLRRGLPDSISVLGGVVSSLPLSRIFFGDDNV